MVWFGQMGWWDQNPQVSFNTNKVPAASLWLEKLGRKFGYVGVKYRWGGVYLSKHAIFFNISEKRLDTCMYRGKKRAGRSVFDFYMSTKRFVKLYRVYQPLSQAFSCMTWQKRLQISKQAKHIL